MPVSGNQETSNHVVTYQELLDKFSCVYEIEPSKPRQNDTTKHFTVKGHAGNIGVISTMTAPFCSDCNRMRLTADGKLKNCLFSKGETDLLSALRNGDDVLLLIHQNIRSMAKGMGGQMEENLRDIEEASFKNRSMITLGGEKNDAIAEYDFMI